MAPTRRPDADGEGRLRYEDRDATPGASYEYRLRYTSDSADRRRTITVPAAATSLRSCRIRRRARIRIAYSSPRQPRPRFDAQGCWYDTDRIQIGEARPARWLRWRGQGAQQANAGSKQRTGLPLTVSGHPARIRHRAGCRCDHTGVYVPWVDWDECTGCNLCSARLPAPGCITMIDDIARQAVRELERPHRERHEQGAGGRAGSPRHGDTESTAPARRSDPPGRRCLAGSPVLLSPKAHGYTDRMTESKDDGAALRARQEQHRLYAAWGSRAGSFCASVHSPPTLHGCRKRPSSPAASRRSSTRSRL